MYQQMCMDMKKELPNETWYLRQLYYNCRTLSSPVLMLPRTSDNCFIFILFATRLQTFAYKIQARLYPALLNTSSGLVHVFVWQDRCVHISSPSIDIFAWRGVEEQWKLLLSFLHAPAYYCFKQSSILFQLIKRTHIECWYNSGFVDDDSACTYLTISTSMTNRRWGFEEASKWLQSCLRLEQHA